MNMLRAIVVQGYRNQQKEGNKMKKKNANLKVLYKDGKLNYWEPFSFDVELISWKHQYYETYILIKSYITTEKSPLFGYAPHVEHVLIDAENDGDAIRQAVDAYRTFKRYVLSHGVFEEQEACDCCEEINEGGARMNRFRREQMTKRNAELLELLDLAEKAKPFFLRCYGLVPYMIDMLYQQLVDRDCTLLGKKYDLPLMMYANEPCRICGELIQPKDLSELVFAGYSKNNVSRSAHGKCWVARDECMWVYAEDAKKQTEARDCCEEV